MKHVGNFLRTLVPEVVRGANRIDFKSSGVPRRRKNYIKILFACTHEYYNIIKGLFSRTRRIPATFGERDETRSDRTGLMARRDDITRYWHGSSTLNGRCTAHTPHVLDHIIIVLIFGPLIIIIDNSSAKRDGHLDASCTSTVCTYII